VSFPADETSIEAVQQLCGNLFSALLVPLCEVAASSFDVEVLPGIGPNKDIRGDSLVLVLLTLATTLYFTTFNAPLKRTEFDSHS
jgi:FLVCR family feline leukemia virus subgroup C receptor-related protein